MAFLRDDILAPIPGEFPAGKDIRYDPLQIKLNEARREDDDAPTGEWARERKIADHKTILKLGAEAVATKSKDLWIAAWLTESLVKTQGFAGFHEGFLLIKGIVENFWDGCYPLAAIRNEGTDDEEDGDMELRAAPIEYVGTKMVPWLKLAPITKAGGFFRYKESRAVGSEADVADNTDKQEKRLAAMAEGKISVEDWDSAENATSTDTLKGHLAALDGTLEALEALNSLCDEKFGGEAPALTPLREALTEVRHTIGLMVRKRGEDEAPAEEEAEETSAEDSGGDGWSTESDSSASAAPRKKKSGGAISLEPQDAEEIGPRLDAIAKFMRAQDAYNPSPYLMLRGFRWGELRSYGASPDPRQLVAPPSSMREKIKLLALDGNWAEMLEAAETVMSGPGGRAWLDLQRWVVRAAENLGYPAIADGIKSELRALVTDLPGLTGMTLMDDSPCANQETKQWINGFTSAPPAQSTTAAADDGWGSTPEPEREEESSTGEPKPPDAYDLANEQVRWGNTGEAVRIMMREIALQPSGRSKFQRKIQLAYILMTNSHEQMAQPILEQLLSEIDEHKLEKWETGEMLANPLAMLYRCMGRGEEAEIKQKLYGRIARLDPVQALNCAR